MQLSKEAQEKVDELNERIDRMKAIIKTCYNNNERARLDGEIKKCRAEIEEVKRAELKPMKGVTRIDDPTALDRNVKNNSVPMGSIRRSTGGTFSVNI